MHRCDFVIHLRHALLVFLLILLCVGEVTLADTKSDIPVVAERVEAERQDAFNPYVITAHKHNFFLPLSYTSNVNKPSFELQDAPEGLSYKPYEVNFQISLKSQFNQNDLLFAGDALNFGITIESWWQLYNAPLSSPFRETNYQPEVFYLTPLLWGPFDGKTALSLGLEHQSNGQLNDLSRSWKTMVPTTGKT